MFNAATEITAAAIKADKIPTDAEKIADFHFKVCEALKMKHKNGKDAATSSRAYVLAQ